ncbi:MAG: leucine-rich repeat protein, partial [bacterium]
NTLANGGGTSYADSGSATFTMGSANVTLYAKWISTNTYTVTYSGNGNTGGAAPTDSGAYLSGATVTVLTNSGALAKTGCAFSGWNTSTNGLGTDRAANSTFTMGSANVTLYAKWIPTNTYTVTYDGNGNTGGSAPTDSGAYLNGATVTVLSNSGMLTKADFTFTGWNTATNGTGTSYAASGGATFTMGSANVILYAQWAETNIYTYTINSAKITLTGYTGPGGAVVIPDTINGLPVTSIGDYAFYDIASLTTVSISTNVTSIGDRAFFSCTGLTGVTIPASVTNIGSWAFQFCTKLTSVTIPSGVTRIGESTFDSCTGLASVTIPFGVTSIGEWAFYNCAKLTGVTLPASVTGIGNWAFKSCAKLTGMTLPSGVTHIANGVFESCAALTGVSIPASVTSIGNSAFYSCTSLTGVTLPAGVTNIGVWAFASCTKLTSVTIPSGVTHIGDRAFDSCSSLTGVTIPASVTSIGSGAFDSCAILAGVTIPANVTTIGDWAFYSCAKLPGATIPAGVTRIGNGVFEACTNLASVTIPAGVISIGDWAFYSCTKLTGVTIPTVVASIGEWAFASCAGLTGVYFKGDTPVLGSNVFDLATSVSVYYMPGTAGWPTPAPALFAGRPTVLWNPQVLSGAGFGVAANHFGFSITGTSGMIVVVEASTDLIHWSPLQTIPLTGGAFSFSDPDLAESHAARFYRLRMP